MTRNLKAPHDFKGTNEDLKSAIIRYYRIQQAKDLAKYHRIPLKQAKGHLGIQFEDDGRGHLDTDNPYGIPGLFCEGIEIETIKDRENSVPDSSVLR